MISPEEFYAMLQRMMSGADKKAIVDAKQKIEAAKRPYMQVVADMLADKGAGKGHIGLLHPSLMARMSHVANLCSRLGVQLKSRQIMAVLISLWIADHPDEIPYGNERAVGKLDGGGEDGKDS